jgi:hypothetical protein
VVVLSIVMLASVAVVPGFVRYHQGSQLDWAARRTLALAAEARGLAVSGEALVTLSYDRSRHGLRLTVERDPEQAAEAAAQGAAPPVAEAQTADSLRLTELPLDVELSIEDETGRPLEGLVFYPDGRSEAAVVRLGREGFPPALLVMNPRTGRLRVEEPQP